MGNFDTLKLSVEAATGGKNTVLLDDMGMPGIYVVIPKFKLSDVIDGAPQDTHPAFIVDGEEKDSIFVSKYQNIVMNDRAYSLPMTDPKTYVNFDQAETYCRNKGRGFHLMTNAEWAAIALWCKKNNTMPRGNNNYGQDHAYAHEKGVVTYVYESGGKKYNGRVATGSGPATWSHDWTNEGIFDMNGNVWEWTAGLRLNEGEIQIIPNNNAATGIVHSPTSSLWKAIMPDGTFVEPGTDGTLKIDGETATPSGIRINTTVVNKTTDSTSLSKTLQTVSAASGVSIPMVLKALGIYPIDADLGGDNFYARNNGERLPLRGGGWGDTASAGVFALHLHAPRVSSTHDVGFRSAFVSL